MIADNECSADSLEPVDAASFSVQRERVGIITGDAKESNVTQVMVASLIVDDELQAREMVCGDTVAEYEQAAREAIDNGKPWPFPPIRLVGNWVTDGVHRVMVARRLKMTHIPAIRVSGDRDEALRRCLKANSKHGLKRSNGDKQRAVQLAVKRWPELSDRQIAKLCAVSHTYVGQVRNPERREERAARVATFTPQPVRQTVDHKPVGFDPFLDAEPTTNESLPSRGDAAPVSHGEVSALDLLEQCDRQLAKFWTATDRLKVHPDAKRFGYDLDKSSRNMAQLLGEIRRQLTSPPVDGDEAF